MLDIVYEDDDYILTKSVDLYECLQKSSNFKIVFDKSMKKAKIYENDELILIEKIPVRSKQIYYFYDYLKDTSSIIDADKIEHILWAAKKIFYNCIHIHFSKDIIKQINDFCYFMVDGYRTIIDLDDFFQSYFAKSLTITDLSDDNSYYAIIRNGIVYFSYLFEDYSNHDKFIKKHFSSYQVCHFHNGNDVISTFNTSRHAVDIQYKSNDDLYIVKVCQFDIIVDELEFLTEFTFNGNGSFNVDVVSSLAFYNGLIYDPKKEFLEELKSLNIISTNDNLDKNIIELYNMSVI